MNCLNYKIPSSGVNTLHNLCRKVVAWMGICQCYKNTYKQNIFFL